jgi:hypothetical protein
MWCGGVRRDVVLWGRQGCGVVGCGKASAVGWEREQ